MKHQAVQLAVIIGVTLFAYGNIFYNQFAWDDPEFLVQWKTLQRWDSVPQLLAGELPARHVGVYRPVRSVIYLAARQLLGGNVIGYHVHSLLVHLAAVVLVYVVTRQLTRQQMMAFFAALLFGVHPVHTEAVTYLTTNFDLWGIVLFLGALSAYLRGQEQPKPWRLVSWTLALLAAFTYEITLVFPLVVFFHALLWRKDRLLRAVQVALPYILVSLSYVAVRAMVIGSAIRSAPLLAVTPWLHALTVVKIFAQYALMTVLPLTQTVYPPLASARGLADPTVLLALGLLAVLVMLGVLAVRKNTPLVAWSVGLFFLALLPVAQIIPAKIIMAERYLYLPSFGFCLLLAWLLQRFLNRSQLGVWLLLAVLVGGYGTLTWQRNRDWRSDATLWAKTVSQVPADARAHHNLGAAFSRQGNYPQALASLRTAVALDPSYAEGYATLGQVLAATEQYDAAVAAFQHALQLEPRYLDAIRNLGDAYLAQEQFTAAIAQYRAYLGYEPNDPAVYNNLGLALLSAGAYPDAAASFSGALQRDPSLSPARLGLALAFIGQQRYQEAQALLTEIVAADPDNEVAVEQLQRLEQLLRSGPLP